MTRGAARRRAAALLGLAAIAALLWWWRAGGGPHRAMAPRDPARRVKRLPPALRLAGGAAEVEPSFLVEPGAEPRRVAGVVLDGDGRPVAGVRVTLGGEIFQLLARPSPRATSDQGGHFDLGAQPPAPLVVTASAAAGDATQQLDLRDPSIDPPADQLVLQLVGCSALARGRVHDLDARPIAGATVARALNGLHSWDARVGGVETAADGGFAICHAGGRLSVSAPGYAPAEVRGPGPPGGFDVTLVAGGEVSGTVVDDQGAGVAGARVVLITGPGFLFRGPPLAQIALSGADGGFRLESVTPGRYKAAADVAGYSVGEHWPEVTVRAGHATGGVAVVVKRCPRRVAGRVVDHGEAVVGARIRIDEWAAAVTQIDGTFVLPCVGEEAMALEIEGLELAADQVPAGSRDIDDLVLTVTAGGAGTVSGRVTRGGQPVAGAVVGQGDPVAPQFLLDPRPRARTGADGRYRLRGLAPGEHALAAFHPGSGQRAAARTAAVAARADVSLDLELEPGVTVVGTLVDAGGAPLAGEVVALVGAAPPGVDEPYVGAAIAAGTSTVTTDSAGGFTLRGVAPGSYAVSLRTGRLGPANLEPAGGWPPIVLRPGEPRVEVHLRAAVRADLVLAGRVEQAGRPVPAYVSLRRGDPAELAVSGRDGRFAFAALVAGRYQLDVHGMDGASARLDLEAGQREIVVALPVPGAVLGAIEGAAHGCAVDLRGDDALGLAAPGRETAASEGRFVFDAVVPGRYRVAASCGDRSGTASVTVEPGETARATIAVTE